MSRQRGRVRRLEDRLRPRDSEEGSVGYRLFFQTADGWTEKDARFTDTELDALEAAGQLVMRIVPVNREHLDARGEVVVHGE